MPGSPPRVSVLMAAHDAERFLRAAVESVLAQTVTDLELVVVDDASTDETGHVLAAVADPRLVVLRNEERQGLAASLNRALERASGRYVARLDADDVALPYRLERQLERIRAQPALAVVGSAILEVDEHGRPGQVHLMPASPRAVRWAALFSSPFYHPSVLFDHELLDQHELRYDMSSEESEDYELWTRVLDRADGANVEEPLVLYRIHPGQATQRRRDVQRAFQLRAASAAIERAAPELAIAERELAWSFGANEPVAPDRLAAAADAFLELLARFEERNGRDREVRESVGRLLVRRALGASPATALQLVRKALALAPGLPGNVLVRRRRRRSLARRARADARELLRALPHVARGVPLRVTVVSPEPTPYRSPLFDRLADLPELELTVLYAAETLADRSWTVEPRHRAVVLGGPRLPGGRRLVHHDYAVTRGLGRALRESHPDVVVVSGWSTFACQRAILWCRRSGVPYVLQVESHDFGPRAGWRRAVKGTVVPRLVRNAAAVLVTGELVRRSMLERGASADRIGLFAVTIDVEAFGRRARTLAESRETLRRNLGLAAEDVAVLSVARLAPEKGLDTLVRAVAAAQDPRLVLVLAGSGPDQRALELLARELDVRLVFCGERPWEQVLELYVAADVFALLSTREPWGVVVNEAAACGLPLVLSDRVGAAYDLLREGENGVLVPAGDVSSAAEALRRLTADAALRKRYAERSRELVAFWGYEPSVRGFADAVRTAGGPARGPG